MFYEGSRKKKNEEDAGPQLPEEEIGRPATKGVKTDWTMYEYESLTSEAEFEAKRKGNSKVLSSSRHPLHLALCARVCVKERILNNVCER